MLPSLKLNPMTRSVRRRSVCLSVIICKIKLILDAVDKSLKKAGAARERKDSFLVVEEHIETKHLPVASDQDEDRYRVSHDLCPIS